MEYRVENDKLFRILDDGSKQVILEQKQYGMEIKSLIIRK